MITLFWISVLLMFYVYIGYPGLVFLLSTILPKKYRKNIENFPFVSVIITAFNEEKNIRKKIENTLALDYDREKFEFIVASDGSTDMTNQIVREFADQGVRLLGFPINRGKTVAQRDAVMASKNEIIVFMDASPLCARQALRELVSNFADRKIGAVAGKLEFIKSRDNLVSESQGIYWKYETFLKRWEGKLGALVGVDGPLYAIRKELFSDIKAEIMEDFITPLLVRRQGYDVIYEEGAITFEETTTSSGNELKTRKRSIVSGFVGLSRYPSLLNIVKRPFLAFQIFSHKILRWLGGFYLICILVSSVMMLKSPFFAAAFAGMLALIVLAIIGFKYPQNKNKLVLFPYYFVLVNVAGLLGFIDFLRGKTVGKWHPIR